MFRQNARKVYGIKEKHLIRNKRRDPSVILRFSCVYFRQDDQNELLNELRRRKDRKNLKKCQEIENTRSTAASYGVTLCNHSYCASCVVVKT